MRPLKTYIVEDSQVIRDDLIATLEELAPIEVVGTAEGESSAVAWLVQRMHEIDLVIVDIFLKDGSGLGVLRAVSSRLSKTNVIVLSNYATADMRRKCLALGAHRVFDKSRELEALLQYCERLAANKTRGEGNCAPA